MAIKVDTSKNLNAVEIICRHDDAVDNEQSDWDAYDADPVRNIDKLTMKSGEEPTRFICNFDVTAKQMATIRDAAVSGQDEDKNIKMSFGKWQYEVVRHTLKTIKNPEGLPNGIIMKKDGRGGVDERTMTLLEKCGVIPEIFKHFNAQVMAGNEAQDIKN